MRTLLACLLALVASSMRADTPVFASGDVILASHSYTGCYFEPYYSPFAILVIPRGATAPSFSYPLSIFDQFYFAAYSSHTGLMVSGGDFPSSLARADPDGTIKYLGAAPLVPNGYVSALVPTATNMVARAFILSSTVESELWTISDSGVITSRDSLPTGSSGDVTSLGFDMASDQCTIYYTIDNRIARYDLCTHRPLSDFSTADRLLFKVRIAPDGTVFATDELGQLLRFSADGTPEAPITLPLDLDVEGGVSAIAFDETGTGLWVATGLPCGHPGGRLLLLDSISGRVLSDTKPTNPTQGDEFNGVTVVGEWHAATSGRTSRKRAVR